jgi:hypothetical protein
MLRIEAKKVSRSALLAFVQKEFFLSMESRAGKRRADKKIISAARIPNAERSDVYLRHTVDTRRTREQALRDPMLLCMPADPANKRGES